MTPDSETDITRYIELALRLAKWDASLVDSYYGRSELATAVAAEEKRKPAELLQDADRLLSETTDRWRAAQVGALRAAAARLAGHQAPYLSMVEQSYGFEPKWFNEKNFELAHALLDDALPGSEPIAVRRARWLAETTIPPSLVEPTARALADDFRTQAHRLVGLPEGGRRSSRTCRIRCRTLLPR